jgi:hypothetical protein
MAWQKAFKIIHIIHYVKIVCSQRSVLLRASALDKVMFHCQRINIKVAESRETCEETTSYTRYRFQEFIAAPHNMAYAAYRPYVVGDINCRRQ